MALGFTYSTGGGDFTAIMKYDARAGRMFREDRKQDSGGTWIKDSVDVTNNFKAVFDFENIEVGWINFPQGGAPDFCMAALGDPYPQRPSNTHMQGVRFMLKLAKDAAGDGAAIRELAGKGDMYWSSGAISHLVKRNAKTGEIKAWPIAEATLTLTPANPMAEASVKSADEPTDEATAEPPKTAEHADFGGRSAVLITFTEPAAKAAARRCQ